MERKHYEQRIIQDIKNEDIQVQITGYVKDIEAEYIILDDKSGEIKVIVKDIKDFDNNFKKNDLINIFGDINLSMDGEKILNARIIQDMNKLNFKYYKKLYNIRKEVKKI
jgi:uncharacterized protein YdeI (BOF family)